MHGLRALVGQARVVALGEATHGTREFFQLKHRMLEFLVEEMGFRVFAIEANWPECLAINDYVLHGEGDPEEALAGIYFWTWNTEEVLELIEWMRRYNADPAHEQKLKFYGVDMQYTVGAASAIDNPRQADIKRYLMVASSSSFHNHNIGRISWRYQGGWAPKRNRAALAGLPSA